MNPSAFVNQQPANPYALPLPNGAANPGASGSAGPGLNGTPAAGSGGASPAGVVNGDVKMEEGEEVGVGGGKEVEGGEGENGEGGPSKREQEREEHDLDLADLLDKMDDWKSVIPDEVMEYYLQKSGFETNDIRVKRLLALATQRFISSIAADSFQYARSRTAATRAGAQSSKHGKTRARTVLTMDDLSAALKEYGVQADRAAYYL